jgi:hypothetical protein
LSIGAVSFFNWRAAAEIQLDAPARRVVLWIAAFHFLGFAVYVIFVSREFFIASVNTVPAMIFLLFGYVRVLRRAPGGQHDWGFLACSLLFGEIFDFVSSETVYPASGPISPA